MFQLPTFRLPGQELVFFPDYTGLILEWTWQHLKLKTWLHRHLVENEQEEICWLSVINYEYNAPRAQDGLQHVWVPLPELQSIYWRDPNHMAVLYTLHRIGFAHPRWAPWDQPDWYTRVQARMYSTLATKGYEILGSQQIKGGWDRTAIIRVETLQGNLFLKAGNSGCNEGHVLLELMKQHPLNVPHVIAHHPLEKWTVMQDFGSPSLVTSSIEVMSAAIERFADIQHASIEFLERLTEIGCEDRSSASILKLLEALLVDEEFGGEQAWQYTVREVRKCLPEIESQLRSVEVAGIPLCLHNEDFRDGNIMVADNQFVLYDWNECVIAHPFFSMAYFLRRLKGYSDKSLAASLLETYLSTWQNYLPQSVLFELFESVRALLNVYEIARCYAELKSLDPGSPWAINTKQYIHSCVMALGDVDHSH